MIEKSWHSGNHVVFSSQSFLLVFERCKDEKLWLNSCLFELLDPSLLSTSPLVVKVLS